MHCSLSSKHIESEAITLRKKERLWIQKVAITIQLFVTNKSQRLLDSRSTPVLLPYCKVYNLYYSLSFYYREFDLIPRARWMDRSRWQIPVYCQHVHISCHAPFITWVVSPKAYICIKQLPHTHQLSATIWVCPFVLACRCTSVQCTNLHFHLPIYPHWALDGWIINLCLFSSLPLGRRYDGNNGERFEPSAYGVLLAVVQD